MAASKVPCLQIGNNKNLHLGEHYLLKMSEMCFSKGYHKIFTMFCTYKAHKNSSPMKDICLWNCLATSKGAAH
jgi:hypothetical protein